MDGGVTVGVMTTDQEGKVCLGRYVNEVSGCQGICCRFVFIVAFWLPEFRVTGAWLEAKKQK